MTLLKDVSRVADSAECGITVLEDMATIFRVAKTDLVKTGRILNISMDSDGDFLFVYFTCAHVFCDTRRLSKLMLQYIQGWHISPYHVSLPGNIVVRISMASIIY